VPQVPARISSRWLVAAASAVAIFFQISSADAQVAATVDGQQITELDVQQRTKFHEMATHKTPPRQDIIDELGKEIQEIEQAERHATAPSDAEVNDTFENIAMNMNLDSRKLTELLTEGGASAATLKQLLRAQIARSRLERAGYDPRGDDH
jgi:peptidyl-prolyl cis-trans isomerase SurA